MQLPKNAKQVHNGILFNVYQWEQEMFNGTTETFERLTRVPSVEVIASIGEDILTIVQEQPAREGKYPSLPGGRIDPGEEPLAAAKRELLEETGYEAEEWQLWRTYPGTSKIHFSEYIYIAKGLKTVREKQEDAGEKISLHHTSFNDFLNMCRDTSFTAAMFFKFEMYEMLLDEEKKEAFYREVYGER